MFTFPRLIPGALFVFLLFTTVIAQEKSTASAPTVTASATTERVRFVGPGSVVQLRLEVYDDAGRKLFDTELRGGNVLDWYLQDGAGQRVQNGSYACVVTTKSLSGRLSQRIGMLTVDDKSAAIEASAADKLSAAQQQSIGPLEGDAALIVLQENEEKVITAMIHDGTDGQIARTKGALSFRTGDFFSGNDKEQMRLTEDGRLGIGTSNPQGTLDVAGTIRAEQVLLVRPGTSTVGGAGDAPQALIAGSGTQDRIAKWIDNSGTLGNSGITETAVGMVGIGTTAPQSLLHIGENPGYGSTTGLLITNNLNGGQFNRAFQIAPRQTASPVTNSIMMYALPTVNSGVTVPGQFGLLIGGKLGPGTITSYAGLATGPTLNAVNNTHLLMGTSVIPSGNFSIYDGTGYKSFFKGNLGLGTTTPRSPLEVIGDVRLGNSGQLFAPGADEKLRIVRGVISVEGNIVAGSGFQVTHSAAGHYVITFDNPFAGVPSVTATSALPGETVSPTVIAVQTANAGNVTVRQYCHDLNICRDADGYFHFIAIGPR